MNTIALSGRAGADAELRKTPNGTVVAHFRLAVDRRNSDEPMWVNCVAFGALAEKVVGPYVTKGKQLEIVGRLEPDNFDGDTTKYRSFNVVINELELGPGPRSEDPQPEPSETPAGS